MIRDTNALSAFVDGEPGAVDQMARAALVAIPVIVLGEYRYGIAQSRLRADYERWLENATAGKRHLDRGAVPAAWIANSQPERPLRSGEGRSADHGAAENPYIFPIASTFSRISFWYFALAELLASEPPPENAERSNT